MTMERWIGMQDDPVKLRADLVEAVQDPTISYRAIWLVLREDGLPFTSHDIVRNWWLLQPESGTHE
jgi:hypothetical protein